MEEKNHIKTIKIYLISPFPQPYIHYTTDENQKNWQTVEMQKSDKQRDLYVFKTNNNFKNFVYVFCSQDKKKWCNPNIEQNKPKNIKDKKNFVLKQQYINKASNNTVAYKQKGIIRFLVYNGIQIKLTKQKFDKNLIVVTDLDDTLICHFNNMPQNSFMKFYLKNFLLNKKEIKLIYNTGRSEQECINLLQDKQLFYPDYLILAGGTKLFNCMEYQNQKLKCGLVNNVKYINSMNKNFNEKIVKQFFEEQNPFLLEYVHQETDNPLRVGYLAPGELIEKYQEQLDNTIKQLKQKYKIEAKMIISGLDYQHIDIVPIGADKGEATKFCVEKLLNMDMKDTVSFGDSRNDCQMLQYTNRAFIVRNSKPGLKKWWRELDQKKYSHIKMSPMEFSYSLILYLTQFFDIL